VSKYDRKVTLLCPTCGGTQFASEGDVSSEEKTFNCASCGRQMTKDELIRENSENISLHVKDIKEEAAADIKKQLKDALGRAFKGGINIRLG
jgi:tRNA(Ile2) C34 agmatinyltransferase TiaS